MIPKECKHFDSCSAPLCPLRSNNSGGDIWYPDEEICQSQALCQDQWIRNQKKIARKARNKSYCFTYNMLTHNCVIGRGIEGIDPDKTEIDDEKAVTGWLIKHPQKREVSQAEREKARERMLELNRSSNPSENTQKRRENNSKIAPGDEEKHPTNDK